MTTVSLRSGHCGQAEEARRKFEADQAAYERETARVRALEEEYKRQLQAWKAAGGKER